MVNILFHLWTSCENDWIIFWSTPGKKLPNAWVSFVPLLWCDVICTNYLFFFLRVIISVENKFAVLNWKLFFCLYEDRGREGFRPVLIKSGILLKNAAFVTSKIGRCLKLSLWSVFSVSFFFSSVIESAVHRNRSNAWSIYRYHVWKKRIFDILPIFSKTLILKYFGYKTEFLSNPIIEHKWCHSRFEE